MCSPLKKATSDDHAITRPKFASYPLLAAQSQLTCFSLQCYKTETVMCPSQRYKH